MSTTDQTTQSVHPVLAAHRAHRSADLQLRVADAITAFAGSMRIVSLEAIFLSTFVMIGQNRQADFAQAKANHDFLEQEQELKLNTDLTKAIHAMSTAIH